MALGRAIALVMLHMMNAMAALRHALRLAAALPLLHRAMMVMVFSRGGRRRRQARAQQRRRRDSRARNDLGFHVISISRAPGTGGVRPR